MTAPADHKSSASIAAPDTCGAFENALAVLRAASPEDKCARAAVLSEQWHKTAQIGQPLDAAIKAQWERPARPSRPALVPPAQVPRRRLGSVEGRIALLHAVAHIELNAIDLAADMICRFADDPILIDPPTSNSQTANYQRDFITDWISVCADEARHFQLIRDRLNVLGVDYGDHVAHDGLWEAALSTRHDIAARLAIAPMVLEARGLDVTPAMIQKLVGAGDNESAAILQIIYDDEIGHVAAGTRWFSVVAHARERDVKPYFHALIREHFSGALKRPFNADGRMQAGLDPDFYIPLA